MKRKKKKSTILEFAQLPANPIVNCIVVKGVWRPPVKLNINIAISDSEASKAKDALPEIF